MVVMSYCKGILRHLGYLSCHIVEDSRHLIKDFLDKYINGSKLELAFVRKKRAAPLDVLQSSEGNVLTQFHRNYFSLHIVVSTF